MESDFQLKSEVPANASASEQAPAQASNRSSLQVLNVQRPATVKPVQTENSDASMATTEEKSKAGEKTTQLSGGVDATHKTGTAVNSGAAQADAQNYKIVHIPQADGSMKKFRRRIVEGNKSATTSTPLPRLAPAGSATEATKGPAQNYKIVLIPQADGSMKKFRRRIVQDNESAAITTQSPTVSTTSNTVAPTKKPTESTAINIENEAKDSKFEKELTPTTVAKDVKADVPQEKSADMNVASLAQALQEQQQNMRERKMHGFKSKLMRGLAVAVGSSIPAFEISADYHDGDEEMSDDDDWSGEEENDDENDPGHDNVYGHSEHDAEEHGSAEHNSQAASNLIETMAARATQPPPRQAPPMVSDKENSNGTEKDRVTYKLTPQDLEDLDRTAGNLRPLKRHWANITFYILASLSILLPLLFLVLAIVVFLMNGKRLDSNGGVLQQVIKVGVSAWPIIFAAVVAQVFKTFATFKVERGIKLMELEQLVGSNSFASAVKQPILLRRLDVLSLLLFVTWCISPLGSSALQRTYTTDYLIINTTSTAYYLNTTGQNRLFNRAITGTGRYGSEDKSWFDMVQDIAVMYVASFTPESVSTTEYVDDYNHPRPPWLDDNILVNVPTTTSEYGIPMVLTDSIFDVPGDGNPNYDPSAEDPRLELTNFVTRSNYFNFTCGSWSVVDLSFFNTSIPVVYFNKTTQSATPCSELAATDPSVFSDDSNYANGAWNCTEKSSAYAATDWTLSPTNTSHSRFWYQDPTVLPELFTVNSIQFASLIKGPGSTQSSNSGLPVVDDKTTHALIQCDFEQVFIEFGVGCSRTAISPAGIAECHYEPEFRPVYQVVDDPVGDAPAYLGKVMADGFATYTTPNMGTGYTYASTPNEIFLGLYGQAETFNTNDFNLSALATPAIFAKRMGYLFNTFANLGNFYDLDTGKSFITNMTKARVADDTASNFIPVRDAYWAYTGPEIYVLDLTWAIIFLICVIILLVAGVVSVTIESLTVAPDTLGYVSSVARNSKHLHLPKTKVNSTMSGGERAKVLGRTVVMMQDVKPGGDIGRIALGMKHDKAQKLQAGRLYR